MLFYISILAVATFFINGVFSTDTNTNITHAQANIVARVTASRITTAQNPHVAPLAVHFDATETTCTQ